MKQKIVDEEIKKKIKELLENHCYFMSIRKVTMKLNSEYGIKRSPQVIKRHLLMLADEGVIEKKK